MEAEYFVNHGRVYRFPWSLYHRPIQGDLRKFLRLVADSKTSPRVLVVGCGLGQEIDAAPSNIKLTAVDIDPRAIALLQARRDPRVVRAEVVLPDQDLRTLGETFDAVFAKEVIEHIEHWRSYLDVLRRILEPGGRLWLSTPNYGEPWLPLLERTFLEIVARHGGYSRKNIHPSQLSAKTLEHGLASVQFTDIDVRVTSFRLALVAWATAGPTR
ncbi:class I SAM-dependent methyltransferase [Anaeromyxobacter diazotrophicus]|uniref:Methyltransferase type 11 n=1 Tax=Anaeromyxobacter diazotrophicus TaxID=2590199 RepID=A0A7I9VKV5_9BACT|nr:methyltransferase domain-containing protein [Anaeromyxobacter diazotrophicus]GEJ57043.1 hypothetical protein AMYX_17840 [Anaeromyxobacter diazotrophicus]